MMKFIGCICIISVSSLTGYHIFNRYRQKLKLLTLIDHLCSYIIMHLEHQLTPTHSLLLIIGKNNKFDSLNFISSAYDLLSTGYDLPSAFSTSVHNWQYRSLFSPHELDRLISLGDIIGSCACHEQVLAIKQLQSEFSLFQSTAKLRLDKEGLLIKNLGLLCGFAITLILL